MSWQINGTGKYYHDYSEYLRAKEEAENSGVAARQRERAEQLLREMRELEQLATSAEGNTAAGREAAEGLRQRMQELTSLADRINSSILAEQVRMQQEFESFSASAIDSAQEQERLRQDFDRWRGEWHSRQTLACAEMERMMQDQKERVRTVEMEMASRRQEQHKRLESDRAARMAKETDAMSQMNVVAGEIEALAAQLAGQADTIGATEFAIRASSLRTAGQSAVKQAQTAGASAGLIATSGCWMEAAQLREEVEAACARMNTARQRAAQFVKEVQSLCSSPEVGTYFAREVANLTHRLAEITQESERVFANWGTFNSRWPKWEQQLMHACDEARAWAVQAPEFDRKAAWRQNKLVEAISALEETAGPIAEDPDFRLVDESDNKSILVCDLVFVSGEKIRLALDIQGAEGPSVKVDSWGHHDDATCADSYSRISAVIKGMSAPVSAQQNHAIHGRSPQPAMPRAPRGSSRAPGTSQSQANA